MKFAVLGAGPMGLMAAMELLKAGHDVDVYERDDRIGGMSASFDFDGLTIERYYHFVCKTDDPLFELLRELGIEDRLKWTDTKMGFYCDGRLYKWGTPFALLAFDKLGLVDKLRYALHVMKTKSVSDWRELDKVPIIPWLKKSIGERAYKVLWERLFHLKFYEYKDHLSAAWLGTRIKRVALSRRNLLQESLGFIEGGSETLLDRMEQYIRQRGGRFHLGAGIDQVTTSGGKVRGVVVRGVEQAVDGVISTAPIQYVPRLVPDLPADFVARIQAIENIPVVCVILKLKQPLSENFWMNICDERIEIPGVIEYSNLNPGTGPAVVYAPFYMPKTHPKFARDNAAFIEEVLGYLPHINPAFRRDWVLAAHCHRYEFAQAVCPPGFYAMLPPMRTPIQGFCMADTAYYYPEDRSICESVKVAKDLVAAALS
ncbi:NAD(P)/FAD-dependent oxidoreductase [Tahibacter amnicola]|uniref:NAD(P)/FAD-dependent oxidoreductase n=1 Tax=Tahibacter amnicola TaxID=2976241 RepID=A0ABY6BLF5_9GAMM|nr:NAD(P)/FAD-dependent oxidoreductase [Tahibacter amnicola]UXI69220.1 NAD(P)/FAD-dependent oxidoreductase [Tahibacter amnicola]